MPHCCFPHCFGISGPTPPTSTEREDPHYRRAAVKESAWKAVSGITVETVDPSRTTKLPKPGVRFRVHEASATGAPWVDSDAWRILRQPSASFFYEAPGESAAIAAAEAFTYGANAVIHTDQAGLKPLGAMLAFLAVSKFPNCPR